MTDQIRVVIFQDGGTWVAQCLEHDIGAQAANLEDLMDRLGLALEVERQTSIELHGRPFAGIDPAPPHFFDRWEKCSGSFAPKKPPVIKGDHQDVGVQMALCA